MLTNIETWRFLRQFTSHKKPVRPPSDNSIAVSNININNNNNIIINININNNNIIIINININNSNNNVPPVSHLQVSSQNT